MKRSLAKAAKGRGLLTHDDQDPSYVLKLFITGNTPRSARSILNVRSFCQRFLEGRYELKIVDICQEPTVARDEQIIAAPTLIKSFPLPFRRLVGDFSDQSRVATGLDVATADL
jgi:circadian clock protein KaiB